MQISWIAWVRYLCMIRVLVEGEFFWAVILVIKG